MARKVGSAEYRVEPLAPNHDRSVFSCGVSELDAYLQRQASQDLKRNLASVFILTADGNNVAGFYTLTALSILATDLPDNLAKKLPRYPLPVTLHGQGWEEFLLLHALKRAWIGSRQVASWAVVVDAKAGAREFYLHHDFTPLPNWPNRLFLPMKAIETIFEPS